MSLGHLKVFTGIVCLVLLSGCESKPKRELPPSIIRETTQADLIIEGIDPDGAVLQIMAARTSVWEGKIVGTVLDADYVAETVLIDKGFGQIQNGWQFDIRRGGRNGKLIAIVQVVRVGNTLSTCDVVEMVERINKGDTIISK